MRKETNWEDKSIRQFQMVDSPKTHVVLSNQIII